MELNAVSRSRANSKMLKAEPSLSTTMATRPTEIRATLAAAKPSGRRGWIVLFQPHRYTRTQALFEEFARSFYDAEVVLLTDIYAASEDPLPEVTSERLAREIERFGHRHASYVGDLDSARSRLAEAIRPGDLVLTLGAGKCLEGW
jgi:UDP-N-acetylmuramate--alanine ligase